MYRQKNASSVPKTNPFDAKGFDEWFVPISSNIPQEHEIFLVDFKTKIFQEADVSDPSLKNLGLQKPSLTSLSPSRATLLRK